MTQTSSSSPGSPCTHLLKSNNAPTETEIPPIQLFISENQSRLDALDVQIDDLRAQMQRLQSQRDAVADCVRRHIAVVSVLRRVPPELISEIFVWTLAGGQTWDAPPWYLGLICRSWRGIALSTPFLWSCIVVESRPHTHAFLALETLLHRSSNAPLDVQICWSSETDVGLLDMVLAHSNRWRTVLVCALIQSPDVFSQLAGVYGQLSQLTTFKYIISGRVGELADGGQNLSFLSVAPRLHQLFLTSSSSTTLSPRLLLPSAQITRYFARFDAAVHRDILSATPNLVECILTWGRTHRESEPSRATNGIVSLHRLRRLRVENSSILEHLSAPSLQHLILEGNFDAAPAFVKRSSCVLQQLMLTDKSNSAPETFLSLLRALPKLEYLVSETGQYFVGDSHSMSQVVLGRRGMTITGSSDDLLPNLKLLACFWRDYTLPASEMASFWTMIESRHGPSSVHPLQTLRLLAPRHSPSWAGEVQNFAEKFAGMDIKLLRRREKNDFMNEHHGFPEYAFHWN